MSLSCLLWTDAFGSDWCGTSHWVLIDVDWSVRLVCSVNMEIMFLKCSRFSLTLWIYVCYTGWDLCSPTGQCSPDTIRMIRHGHRDLKSMPRLSNNSNERFNHEVWISRHSVSTLKVPAEREKLWATAKAPLRMHTMPLPVPLLRCLIVLRSNSFLHIDRDWKEVKAWTTEAIEELLQYHKPGHV